MEGTELVAFNIIASVGTARSSYIAAIDAAAEGKFEEAEQLIKEGMRSGIRRFVMECTAANLTSRHVIEKCGFEYSGIGEDGLLVFRKDS